MLASKKQEGKITLMERLKLAFHNVMCVYCKRFEQQAKIIARRVKQTSVDRRMPDEAKKTVKNAIKSL